MSNDKRWVGTWAAAPAPAEGVVGSRTRRSAVTHALAIGGERLRVRISKCAHGNRPRLSAPR